MVLVKVRRGLAVVPVVLRVDFEEAKKPAPAVPAAKPVPAKSKAPAATPAPKAK
jgi:hypothetical protein